MVVNCSLHNMKQITIGFTDFWDNFDPLNNFITNTLRKNYNVIISNPSDNCDILFFANMGYSNLFYLKPIKVYYTGENDIPDFNVCDYAISFHEIDFNGRHLRLPLYVWYPSFEILRQDNVSKIDWMNRDFCSFVVSNNWCSDPIRTNFFNALSSYKTVASGGKFANNIGGPVADKMDFIRQYKFNIAFENSNVPGYTTEKIFDAFAAGTVPIYWGNPDVYIDVNPDAFINIQKFPSIHKAIEYIALVDNDQTLYKKYLEANPILNNPFMDWENKLLNFLIPICEYKQKKMPQHGFGGNFRLNANLRKEDLNNSNFVKKTLKIRDSLLNLKKSFKK